MVLFLAVVVFYLLFRDVANKAVYYSMTDEGKDEGFGIGNIQAPEIRIEDDTNETLIAFGIVSVLFVIAIAILFSICYHKRRDLLLWMAKDDNVLVSRFIKSENTAEAETKLKSAIPEEPKAEEPPPEPDPPPKPKLTMNEIKAMLRARQREQMKKAAIKKPRPVKEETTPSKVPKALPGMLEGVLFVTELAEETQKRVQEKEEAAAERWRLEDSDSQPEEDQRREETSQNKRRPKKSRSDHKKSKGHRRRSRVEE